MDAIIYRSPEAPLAGSYDVAGRPLVIRQLQWLREIGVERAAVELAPVAEHAAIVRALDADLALTAGVQRVVTHTPRSPEEIARRAGLGRRGPLLLVPSHVLGGADLVRLLPRMARSTRFELRRPHELAMLPAAYVTIVLPDETELDAAQAPGWGVSLPTALDALELAALVLSGGLELDPSAGELGVQIHAAESRPGVWLARGATVERGARLTAPVYVGADAVVRAGARVGPGVVILDRGVVERGASLHGVVVQPDVIVGEGVELSASVVEPSGVSDLETGERLAVDDPLVLDTRPRRPERRDTRAIVAALHARRATTRLALAAAKTRSSSGVMRP
jgi:hypothetical protein